MLPSDGERRGLLDQKDFSDSISKVSGNFLTGGLCSPTGGLYYERTEACVK